MSYVRRCDI